MSDEELLREQLQQNEQDVIGTSNININLALINPIEQHLPEPGLTEIMSRTHIVSNTKCLDLYRLWAKFFSQVGCPEVTVQIPRDWVPFFLVSLLSPKSLDWAKSFMGSTAWKAMISCSDLSSSLTFALPNAWPHNAAITCASLSDSLNPSDRLVKIAEETKATEECLAQSTPGITPCSVEAASANTDFPKKKAAEQQPPSC